MARVFVGVGSNQDPERQLRLAVQALTDRFGRLRLSTVYASVAVGVIGPDFFNMALEFATAETPQVVAAALRAIEGRQNELHSASDLSGRAIDLDFLLYDEVVLDMPGLRLPREDIQRYAFVLRPLAELAPTLRHPLTGLCLADMWAAYPAHEQSLRMVEIELT